MIVARPARMVDVEQSVLACALLRETNGYVGRPASDGANPVQNPFHETPPFLSRRPPVDKAVARGLDLGYCNQRSSPPPTSLDFTPPVPSRGRCHLWPPYRTRSLRHAPHHPELADVAHEGLDQHSSGKGQHRHGRV